MKRNSICKSLVVSVALSAFLVGCGSTTASNDGDDNNNDTSSPAVKTITGKAVDGYLQHATVCLDINKDGYCQEEEPSAQTAADGSFSLNITPEIEQQEGFKEAMLLVYGGKDVDTKKDFIGKLLAPQGSEIVNISPVTTLIAKDIQKAMKTKKMTDEEIKEQIKTSKERVATLLNLQVEDVTKDPVAHKTSTPDLIKKALKIQKSIEVAIDNENSDEIEKLYEKLADDLDKIAANDDLDKFFEESFKTETEKLNKIKAINKNLDIAFDKFDEDLEKIAYITQEDLKKAKNGEAFTRDANDAHFQSDFDWNKAYIISDLEDIGIKNPTDVQIAKIKEITTDIKPGIIEAIEKELKDDDDFLKQINEALKEKKVEEEKKKEYEKAKKDPKVKVDFKTMLGGKTLYSLDMDKGELIVSELQFDSDVKTVSNGKETIELKIEGNTIITYSEQKDGLTFKKETEDYYAFYSINSEEVKLYKTREKATTSLEEIKNKLETIKASYPDGQFVKIVEDQKGKIF